MNIAQIRLLQTQLDEILLTMQSLFIDTKVKKEDKEVMEELIDNLRTIPYFFHPEGISDILNVLVMNTEVMNPPKSAPKSITPSQAPAFSISFK